MNVKNPIFVIGMGRSGTTLISESLTAHEKVGWFCSYMNIFPNVPEVSFFSRILDLPRIGWYLRGKKNQNKGFQGYLRSLLPYSVEAYPVWRLCCGDQFLWDYMLGKTATDSEKARLTSVIVRILRMQGKDRFCTKITGPPRISYLASVFPDAFFVSVVRDPRATVSSLLKVPFWKRGGGLDRPWWQNGLCEEYVNEWIQNERSPIALAAVQWKQVVEYAWQESKSLADGKYIEIRYEDFIKDPYNVVDDLFSKLELSGSRNAHKFLSTINNVKLNMNNKYKETFSLDDRKLIEKLTKDVALKLGYLF